MLCGSAVHHPSYATTIHGRRGSISAGHYLMVVWGVPDYPADIRRRDEPLIGGDHEHAAVGRRTV